MLFRPLATKNVRVHTVQTNTLNSEIFARILFSQIALRHICDVKNVRLWHDLPIPLNDKGISPFHKDFIFKKLHICEVW